MKNNELNLLKSDMDQIKKINDDSKSEIETLNNSLVELAYKSTPENPPDCVSVAPSVNDAGRVGEPVKLTFIK